MMRMIDALVLARLERIPARHHRALRAAQRKQRRLLERRWPDIRCEGPAVDEHIDATPSLIHDQLDALGLGGPGGEERKQKSASRAADFEIASHRIWPFSWG